MIGRVKFLALCANAKLFSIYVDDEYNPDSANNYDGSLLVITSNLKQILDDTET